MSDVNANEVDEMRKPTTIPEWLTGLAASAILIGAATAYFAGTIYHDRLLEKYGLTGLALQWSLQQTIAYGYYAILRTILPTSISLLIIFVIYLALKLKYRLGSKELDSLDEYGRLLAFIRAAYSCIVFACVGFYAGDAASHIEYRNIEEKISDKCKSCFVYKTSLGQVVGIVIGQDANFVVVITRRGAVVLPAGAIKTIKAINRASPASRWYIL